jgi:hypothetical protein
LLVNCFIVKSNGTFSDQDLCSYSLSRDLSPECSVELRFNIVTNEPRKKGITTKCANKSFLFGGGGGVTDVVKLKCDATKKLYFYCCTLQ